MAKPTLSAAAQGQLDEIAVMVLGLETLETRGQDGLDVHALAVWQIKTALEAAYLAGMVDHYKRATTTQIEQRLTDYLAGYVRNSPESLAQVLHYPDWQRMAGLELDRRATRLLELFSEEELRAIAQGDVSLPDLARSLEG